MTGAEPFIELGERIGEWYGEGAGEIPPVLTTWRGGDWKYAR